MSNLSRHIPQVTRSCDAVAHTVHWRCGARWLIGAQTCPSCRFDMSVDEIVRSKS